MVQPAIQHFRDNMRAVHTFGGLYRSLRLQTTSALDLTDILRCELVMAISALDYYVHELSRLGMLEAWSGKRSSSAAFLRFDVSVAAVSLAHSDTTSNSWLDAEIRSRHGWLSFQQPDKIADAIRLITDEPLWDRVAGELRMTSTQVKTQLRIIVDRRNKIAHEADLDPIAGSRWPISDQDVADAVDFVEEVAEAVFRVVT